MQQSTFTYVDRQEQLAELCVQIRALTPDSCIGIDTEFIRDVSYYPKLCLLQLEVAECSYLVDPLQVNLTELLQALNDTMALLLVYSGSEDFETIVHVARSLGLTEQLKARCLDLQVLISMLNLGYRMGLSKAVGHFLGLELLKTETCSDWAERPLSAAQLEYAALDVKYLKPLYDKLLSLCAPEQLQFALAETLELQLQAFTILEPDEAYLYVDKTARLNAAALTRLQFIVKKRLEYAREIDEAVNRVITGCALAKIAEFSPRTPKALGSCNMKWGAIREHGSEVLRWVEEAARLPADESLRKPLAYFLNASAYQERLRSLKHKLTLAAQQARISPELLTQKRLLADYLFCEAYGLDSARLRQGWRKALTQNLD
ncbi:MAG: hypothetical protein K6F05_06415 [Succinivibrio sp.]|nr:hypothetical protein [Succinivibrio sp.]